MKSLEAQPSGLVVALFPELVAHDGRCSSSELTGRNKFIQQTFTNDTSCASAAQ